MLGPLVQWNTRAKKLTSSTEVLIICISTTGSSVSFTLTQLLTEQNYLTVSDYSTRKTRTDTCNDKRVGRPELNSFFILSSLILQIKQYTPELNKAL